MTLNISTTYSMFLPNLKQHSIQFTYLYTDSYVLSFEQTASKLHYFIRFLSMQIVV